MMVILMILCVCVSNHLQPEIRFVFQSQRLKIQFETLEAVFTARHRFAAVPTETEEMRKLWRDICGSDTIH